MQYFKQKMLFVALFFIHFYAFGQIAEQAATVLESGKAAQKAGQVAEAEKHFLEVLSLLGNAPNKTYFEANFYLASLYVTQKRDSEAEAIYEQALTTAEGLFGKTSPEYLKTLEQLGRTAERLANFPHANQYYSQLVESRKKLSDKNIDYARALRLLASLYVKMELYEEAEPPATRALELLAPLKTTLKVDYAEDAIALAGVYAHSAREAAAEKLILEAVSLLKPQNDAYYYEALNALADFYFDEKRHTEAQNIRFLALALCKTLYQENSVEDALMLAKLAQSEEAKGAYFDAEKQLKQAIAIYENIEQDVNYTKILVQIGKLYRNMMLYVDAEKYLQQGLALQQLLLGENSADYLTTLNDLAELQRLRLRLTAAEPLFQSSMRGIYDEMIKNFAALSENEKKSYLTAKKPYFHNFTRFCLTRAGLNPYLAVNPDEISTAILGDLFNFQLATKGILLNATAGVRQRILSGTDTVLVRLFKDWIAKREYLAEIYNLSKADLEMRGIDLKQLEEEAKQLEKQLAFKSADFKSAYTLQMPTWEHIQKKLKPDEAAIEMLSIDFGTDSLVYVALIVKPDAQPQAAVFKQGKEMEALYLKSYRNSIKLKLDDKKSYLQFWSPIQKALGSDVKTLYFSPEGVYHQISLNTLYNAEKQQFVIDEINIRLLTSIKDILLENKPNTNRNVLLMGRPAYQHNATIKPTSKYAASRFSDNTMVRGMRGAAFSDLPGTENEIVGLQKFFDSNKWQVVSVLKEHATEDTLKASLNPSILHIATHGFFFTESKDASDPLLRSGIVLAGVSNYFQKNEKFGREDGVVTSYEVMNMDLSQTELVTMSACETGLGEIQKGEGVYGLQRALKVAGAKSVIISLWKVDDDATQKLMRLFYENWLGGASKRDAFRKAQLDLRLQYPKPYFWGAFVMSGD